VNFTYTAADAPAGLVPFLNNVTRSPPSRTLRISLPAGTVRRGSGVLSIASGLTIVLQGRGKDGAANTTLDLQKNNLDLGTMLGDTGRMELNGMHVTNVRALPRRAAAYPPRVTSPCAQGFAVSSPPRINRWRSSHSLTQCSAGLFVCVFVCVSALPRLNAHTHSTHPHAAKHTHGRATTDDTAQHERRCAIVIMNGTIQRLWCHHSDACAFACYK
jgi:hypothetical protein